MYKVMHIDDRNFEGDELTGYFDSEEALVESLRSLTLNNRNVAYAGIEQYAGLKCYVVTTNYSKGVIKSRYYLVKIENGWI